MTMDENDRKQRNFSPGITDWAAERKFYGRFYLSQGLKENKQINNDCGPTSLAVILNLFLYKEIPGSRAIGKETVIRSSRFYFWERLPLWLPGVGGATAPWGMVKAFNRFAREYGLCWTAARRRDARRAHLLENLMMGRPVTALKIWKNGGAHWVNLVRYSSEKDRIYFLDPNPFLQHLPEEKRLQSQTWEEFQQDWSRKNWWSKLLGIRNELITYSRAQ